MHGCGPAGPRQKAAGGRTLDIAKRLLDFGFYAPTVYFPLIVDEAIMIEPTESENRRPLDRFVAALAAIAREAEENPELVRTAPPSTPAARRDAARAPRRAPPRGRPAARRVGASRGSVIGYVVPIMALVLGVVALDESVDAIQVGGVVVALLGGWLVSRNDHR